MLWATKSLCWHRYFNSSPQWLKNMYGIAWKFCEFSTGFDKIAIEIRILQYETPRKFTASVLINHGSGLRFGVGCLFLLSSRLKFRLSQAAKNNNTNKSVIHRMIYIYQQGAIIFLSYKITIATLQPLSGTPNFNFVCLLLESEFGDPVFFFAIKLWTVKIHLFVIFV